MSFCLFLTYLLSQAWSSLLPKLKVLLEEKRMHQEEAKRVERVKVLMLNLKWEFHPFQAIIDELHIGQPSEPTSSLLHLGQYSALPLPILDSPFPDGPEALQWDCIKEVYAKPLPIEGVEHEFNLRKPEIERKMSEWRTNVETTLASVFPTDRKCIVEVRFV